MGMLLSWSIGSNGDGLDRFVLYVPFTVSLGCEISSIDREIEHNVDTYKIRLEKLINFYAITVGEFDSIDEAHQFFPKLCSSLLWVSLKIKAGISYPKSITKIDFTDNQIQIAENSNFRMTTDQVGWNELDGFYDANKAVVIPDKRKFIKIELGIPKVVVGVNAENFVKIVSEALSFEAAENVVNNEKLQLAINLYSASCYELSDNAKFITLVTVLEALKPEGEEIPNIAQEVLKLAKSVVKEKLNSYEKNSVERKELEHLSSRFGNLKKQSIGKTIRNYISKIIEEYPDLGNKKDIIDNVEDIYDNRSILLHYGKANDEKIKIQLHFLVNFVPKLLEYLYRKESGQQA